MLLVHSDVQTASLCLRWLAITLHLLTAGRLQNLQLLFFTIVL
jgi:hypothetical protein